MKIDDNIRAWNYTFRKLRGIMNNFFLFLSKAVWAIRHLKFANFSLVQLKSGIKNQSSKLRN
jgi:hypothetical protein